MTTHRSFPNLFRPERWEGEEDHYRSTLKVGDVVRTESGGLARITSWNNTWSHIRGGRLVYLADVREGYGHTGAWENTLVLAEPGDVGSHPCWNWQHPEPRRDWGNWVAVPATWQHDHNDRRAGCPHQLTRTAAAA